MRRHPLLAAFAAVLLFLTLGLAGCGGDDGDSEEATEAGDTDNDGSSDTTEDSGDVKVRSWGTPTQRDEWLWTQIVELFKRDPTPAAVAAVTEGKAGGRRGP